jgi:hypothetical protein
MTAWALDRPRARANARSSTPRRTETAVDLHDRKEVRAELRADIAWQPNDETAARPFELRIVVGAIFDWRVADLPDEEIEGWVH